jgi:hypothetical protein
MAKWYYRLELIDLWKQHKELGPQKLAQEVAKSLDALVIDNEYHETQKKTLVREFLLFSKDNSVDFDDFDEVLEELYQWADQLYEQGRLCWVKTF